MVKTIQVWYNLQYSKIHLSVCTEWQIGISCSWQFKIDLKHIRYIKFIWESIKHFNFKMLSEHYIFILSGHMILIWSVLAVRILNLILKKLKNSFDTNYVIFTANVQSMVRYILYSTYVETDSRRIYTCPCANYCNVTVYYISSI